MVCHTIDGTLHLRLEVSPLEPPHLPVRMVCHTIDGTLHLRLEVSPPQEKRNEAVPHGLLLLVQEHPHMTLNFPLVLRGFAEEPHTCAKSLLASTLQSL